MRMLINWVKRYQKFQKQNKQQNLPECFTLAQLVETTQPQVDRTKLAVG